MNKTENLDIADGLTDSAITTGPQAPPELPLHRPATGLTTEPYLWMLAGSFSFTCMGVWTYRLGLGSGPDADWRVIALFRSAIAFVAALVICQVSGHQLLVFRPAILWLRSFAGCASMVCTFFALTRLPTPEVLTFTNTYPIWISLFSVFVLREWPGWGVIGASAMGVAGVALVMQPHGAADPWAIASALAASVFTAIAMMGLNRLGAYPAWAIVTHFSGLATLTCFLLLIFWPGWMSDADLSMEGTSLLMLAGVGAGATLGQWCLTQAFTKGVAARVSIVGLSQVCFGLLIETIFFGRVWNPVTTAGMAMVLLPTAWIMSRRKG